MIRVGVTMGDLTGIGPEITTEALRVFQGKAHFVAYAPHGLYASIPDLEYVVPDMPNQALAAINASARDLRLGTIDAVVTSPVNKVVFEGGYPGHTELFEDAMGAEKVAMMMYGRQLKTVPVTTHIPLRDVPSALSPELYVTQGAIVHRFFQEELGLTTPRIAMAGLNPHAGDGGLFGGEEESILKPAIQTMRSMGINVSDPISPDTVFHQAVNGHFDAVLCAYHDQALIPFKLLHFSDGVNVTLGLGAPRTSPDHGPAIDIAGKGIADPSSMIEAVRLAIELAEKRRDNSQVEPQDGH